MSEEKVKVHKLAKQFGFKSAEFVKILAKVGFPVTSYQASVTSWDVPIIEERLLKGGLITGEQIEAVEEAGEATEESEVGWSDLASQVAAEEPEATGFVTVTDDIPAPDAPTMEPDSYTEPEPEAEEEPADDPVSEETPSEEEAPQVEEEPSEPTGADETSEPMAVDEDGGSGEEAVVETEVESGDADSSGEEQTEEKDDTAVDEGKVTPKPTGIPKPTGSAGGATKLGMIDLAALKKIKARQRAGRSSTFTDIRDRESARRRDERQRQRERQKARSQGGPAKQSSTIERKSSVVLSMPATVKSFSTDTGIAVNDILGKLMRLGVMATINAQLDEDTIALLADDFGIGVSVRAQEDIEQSFEAELEEARAGVDEGELDSRPPVIAFLGHVDHGKTSLIDAIRQENVVDGEAGGITQHIGAYQVTASNGHLISIIDTPGHEAFTEMRARGAQTTDIVILVVAADDGVMPQTEEAANHAKEAGVPIIVAMNKIDKDNANPDRVLGELANIGLQPEEWGGDTGVIRVSAIQKTGLDELLERVALESELLDLKAHSQSLARGTVLEARVSEGRGKIVHLLVQDGTLKNGDFILAGHSHGKVRRMFDHRGEQVTEAGPSTPVELLGLAELPKAGDQFVIARDAATAKAIAEKRELHFRDAERAAQQKVSLDNLFESIESGQAQTLRLVLKADVQGSLEVLRVALAKLSTNEVQVELVHSGIGGVTESDILLAETAGAIVLGFHVVADDKARAASERADVEIRRYDVIYEMLEDLERGIEGMLSPDDVEEVRGHAEVRAIFRSSKFGTIAGSFVLDGTIHRAHQLRLTRDGVVVYTGKFDSLRRVKDDAREVRAGLECGIKIAKFEDVKVGDIIETFEIVQVSRSLAEARKGDS